MDEHNTPKKVQRWYDKDETVAKSVNLLKDFPEEFQSILGETLIELADKHANAKELMANLRALGPDKVLAIFKAKSRQRFYDANEQVHEAMNHMYIVPDEDRVAIAKQAVEVTEHFNEYFEICKSEGRKPNPEVVAQLGATYLRGELNDLRQCVTKIEKALNSQQRESIEVPDDTSVHSSQQGMKVKLDKSDL
jgi:hypothetical protein